MSHYFEAIYPFMGVSASAYILRRYKYTISTVCTYNNVSSKYKVLFVCPILHRQYCSSPVSDPVLLSAAEKLEPCSDPSPPLF